MGWLRRTLGNQIDPGDFNPRGRGCLQMAREGPYLLLNVRGFFVVVVLFCFILKIHHIELDG